MLMLLAICCRELLHNLRKYKASPVLSVIRVGMIVRFRMIVLDLRNRISIMISTVENPHTIMYIIACRVNMRAQRCIHFHCWKMIMLGQHFL